MTDEDDLAWWYFVPGCLERAFVTGVGVSRTRVEDTFKARANLAQGQELRSAEVKVFRTAFYVLLVDKTYIFQHAQVTGPNSGHPLGCVFRAFTGDAKRLQIKPVQHGDAELGDLRMVVLGGFQVDADEDDIGLFRAQQR